MSARRVLCALLLIACYAGALAAQPSERKALIIPLTLPKNYAPPSMPPHPIDETLRVGLVLPAFDAATSAMWTTAVRWDGTGWTPKSIDEVTVVDRVTLNFAEPLASALPGIMRRLFPRTEIVREPTAANYDLLLVVNVQSHVFDNPTTGYMAGINVIGTINAIAADGTKVATLSPMGTGRVTKSIYWSVNTRAASLGEPALQGMLDKLVRMLTNTNLDLEAFLQKKAAERARPSDLTTTVTFDDSASFFANGRLDAGEHANLQLTIRNQGAGPAFGVLLQLSSVGTSFSTTPETTIGDLLPGAVRNVSIPIAGALDVESVVQTVRIETIEKRGYGGRPVVLQFASEALKRPILEIVDVRLDDGAGRARGDGNGRPSNGETIEATVLVRNRGAGDAVGADLTIASVPGVEILQAKVELPAIPVDTVREARFLVSLPVTFSGAELPLTIQVEETRGAQVAKTEKQQAWPLEAKQPKIEIASRVYDGNSPDSRGDRDGIASNGETLELAITPVNRGTLTAHDVTIHIVSPEPGLSVSPNTFSAGELPPLSEGAEHRVRVFVSRTLGRDAFVDRLRFGVTISQRDFATNDQSITLPFKARRPELVANITSPYLVEGQPAVITLEIRNRGPLAAEKVRLEVSCDNAGLELLDESGAPARKLAFDLATIGSQAIPMKFEVKLYVRRNVAQTATSLAVVVSQADFPAITTNAALTIQREAPAVIPSAVPALAVTEQQVVRTVAAPPSVSFQSVQNGEILKEETIAFRFEVQSQATLREVRLKQNHRLVDQGAPKVTQERGVSAWQYEPRVHLDYGENLFEVTVLTAGGDSQERSMIVNRERPQGRIWVAAVGVSKYANKGVTDLEFARDDAVAVLSYYRELGVAEDHLIQLLDEQATLTNIKRTLGTELANKATNPDDTIVLYFAGHGDKEPEAGSDDGYAKYLLPYDANPSDLFSSALSMEELSHILQRLRSDRVALIVDSCFSGAVGGRTMHDPNVKGRAPLSDEFLTRMAEAGKGRVILTASSSQEVAEERKDIRHGVFTYFLLQGLEGAADADHDERIDVNEIYAFVSKNVKELTKGSQNPTKKEPTVTGTVILGRPIRP